MSLRAQRSNLLSGGRNVIASRAKQSPPRREECLCEQSEAISSPARVCLCERSEAISSPARRGGDCFVGLTASSQRHALMSLMSLRAQRSNLLPGESLSLRAQRSNLLPGQVRGGIASSAWRPPRKDIKVCLCERGCLCTPMRSNLLPGESLSLRAQRSNLLPGQARGGLLRVQSVLARVLRKEKCL